MSIMPVAVQPATERLIYPSGVTAPGSARTTPEDYGARRDCRSVVDAAITNGLTVLTSATAAFTAADLNKTVMVTGAGANSVKNTLVATITAVTNATTVTVSAAASVTVTGARATLGTDDTAAIQAAINAAVTLGTADGSYCGVVEFAAGQYMVAGPLRQGTSYGYGNAQIYLPTVAEAGRKFILVLRGPVPAATFVHWQQTVPQAAGAVLRSSLVGATDDATWLSPACIGGPTLADQGGGFTSGWSNMLLVVDGLTVLAPRDPTFTALYARRIAQLHIRSFAAIADRTATEMHAVKPVNSGGLGLCAPVIGNNDYVIVENYACEGFYYGMTLTDHLAALRLVMVYCVVAMFMATGNSNEHGASILNASVEDCDTVLEAQITSGGRFPVHIAQVNTELAAGTGFLDTNNGLVGYIGYTSNDASAPTTSGATNVRLVDLNQRPGNATAPSVPASTVVLVNPFFRNAAVHIAGGTVTAIKVDTVTTGVTAGLVMVPSGKGISITYSVAPTWVWTLL